MLIPLTVYYKFSNSSSVEKNRLSIIIRSLDSMTAMKEEETYYGLEIALTLNTEGS